jgi:hypothetical protein
MSSFLSDSTYDWLLLGYTIQSFVGMAWYYKRRKKFPIAQRQPFVVLLETLLTNVSIFFSSVPSTSIPTMFPWLSCGLNFILLTITYDYVIVLAGTRIFLVIFWHYVTNTALSQHKLDGSTSARISHKKLTNLQSFVVKWKRFLTVEFFLVLAMVVALVGSISTTSALLWNDDAIYNLRISNQDKCVQLELATTGANGMFTLVVIAVDAILFFWMYFSVQEGLLLKVELFGILVTGSWLTVFLTVHYFPEALDLLHGQNILRFLYSFVSGEMYLLLLVYRIIYWTYVLDENQDRVLDPSSTFVLKTRTKTTAKNPVKRNGPGLLSQLQQVLNSPTALDDFINFLRLEFAVENILFLIDCQSFKNRHKLKNSEMVAAALHIYRRYIAENSQCSVNISSKTREKVKKIFDPMANESRLILSMRSTISRVGSADSGKALLADEKSMESTSSSIDLAGSIKFDNARDSPASIPLSSFERRPAAYGWDGTIFDEAYQEVFELLARDSFTRYKATPDFQKFLNSQQDSTSTSSWKRLAATLTSQRSTQNTGSLLQQ